MDEAATHPAQVEPVVSVDHEDNYDVEYLYTIPVKKSSHGLVDAEAGDTCNSIPLLRMSS